MTEVTNKPNVLIMAGGTGGHVFPALSCAELLTEQGYQVHWLGTPRGIENDLVPKAGYELHRINIAGLRGNGKLSLLLAPFKLVRALWQAKKVVKQLDPKFVLGMGGFVTGPGGLAARLSGVPLVIHEQNAIAGLTNKLLSKMANPVLEAFPGTFDSTDKRPVHWVGNPVRKSIFELEAPAKRLADRNGPLRVLVVGGSLGALAINKVMPEALALLKEQLHEGDRPEVIHQSGKNKLQDTQSAYDNAGVKADVRTFIDNMDEAMGWADLVICRSGALTVSELAAAGAASILVPFPFAVDDHQTANGQFLVTSQAARMIQQSELTPKWLAQQLTEFSNNRALLMQMATAARSQAKPESTSECVDYCLEVSNV